MRDWWSTWAIRPRGRRWRVWRSNSFVLGQLAKLKFNRVLVPSVGWQPPIALRVDGDTAGRGAFRGAKLFENPGLRGETKQCRTSGGEPTLH